MKLLITGASGAGSTTLGIELSARLGINYLDTDDYFWLKTEIPYTEKRPDNERIKMLKDEVASNANCIVGGSLVSWGNDWFDTFDLAIFLYIPKDIRIARLKAREFERYGNIIYTDPQRSLMFKEFIAWAESYDDVASKRRSLRVHKEWLSKLSCPVIEILADTSIQGRVSMVVSALKQYQIGI